MRWGVGSCSGLRARTTWPSLKYGLLACGKMTFCTVPWTTPGDWAWLRWLKKKKKKKCLIQDFQDFTCKIAAGHSSTLWWKFTTYPPPPTTTNKRSQQMSVEYGDGRKNFLLQWEPICQNLPFIRDTSQKCPLETAWKGRERKPDVGPAQSAYVEVNTPLASLSFPRNLLMLPSGVALGWREVLSSGDAIFSCWQLKLCGRIFHTKTDAIFFAPLLLHHGFGQFSATGGFLGQKRHRTLFSRCLYVFLMFWMCFSLFGNKCYVLYLSPYLVTNVMSYIWHINLCGKWLSSTFMLTHFTIWVRLALEQSSVWGGHLFG